MKSDRTYNQEQERTLCYGIGVEVIGEEETRSTKKTWRGMVEDKRRAAAWQSWMTVRALTTKRSG